MIVMKFGGSSLSTAPRIRRAAELVAGQIERMPVVVVSALGSTTDMLIGAARSALAGTVSTEGIEGLHDSVLEDLELDRRIVEPLLHQLSSILHGISLIRELTPRTLDTVMSFGERMSSRIMAATLAGEGVPATAVNSYDIGLVTDSRHGSAAPLAGIEGRIREQISRIHLVPVVTGFLGKDERGEVTTLGRSGSDFTASIIGGAIEAEEVQIWTDVDGVMSADPSICPDARNLPSLSFEEASELAYFGAEVLHPSTLVPAMRANVPVRVLNTLRPGDPGTRIVAETTRGGLMAKSVVYKEDVCLLTLSSPRLMGAVQILASAFQTLTAHGIGIHMAATSEATVSMVTDREYDADLLEAARSDLEKLGLLEIERRKAVVCVVGEEMKGRTDVLSRIFGVVASQGIKARAVSQSASEVNVAFLVDNSEIERTVTALHSMLLGSGPAAA